MSTTNTNTFFKLICLFCEDFYRTSCNAAQLMESMGDFMTKRAQRQYSREKGMSQITEESFLEVCKASVNSYSTGYPIFKRKLWRFSVSWVMIGYI